VLNENPSRHLKFATCIECTGSYCSYQCDKADDVLGSSGFAVKVKLSSEFIVMDPMNQVSGYARFLVEKEEFKY
jgi:hypothetical protein